MGVEISGAPRTISDGGLVLFLPRDPAATSPVEAKRSKAVRNVRDIAIVTEPPFPKTYREAPLPWRSRQPGKKNETPLEPRRYPVFAT